MPLLDLDDADLAVMADALVLLPYGRVAPLIAKINGQIEAQQKPPEDDGEWQPNLAGEAHGR